MLEIQQPRLELRPSQIRDWLARNRPAYKLQGPALPTSIGDVVRLGILFAAPQRVVLYGSRARGDARYNSDYDLAFFGVERPEGISRLRADLEDEPITLLQVDVLDAREASQTLIRNIECEGRVIYERPAATEGELSEGARQT